MNQQNERKKNVTKARVGFTAIIIGAIVTIVANVARLSRDGADSSSAIFIVVLILLVIPVVFVGVKSYGRAQGKRFRAFHEKYPISYLCQTDLTMSKNMLALARDNTDLVVFDITKSEYKELLRMPAKDAAITPAEVSPNGVRKFIGLQVTSASNGEARFVLLNDKSALLLANNDQAYAEEAARQLLA